MSYFNQEFLSNIQQTPCEDQAPICPFCQSTTVNIGEKVETMVGFFGNVNPNHMWTECICNTCLKAFVFEQKLDISWYTLDGKVLRGVAGCCQGYIHTCKCGGDFWERCENKNGTPYPESGLEFKDGNPNQWSVHTCSSCAKQIKIDRITGN